MLRIIALASLLAISQRSYCQPASIFDAIRSNDTTQVRSMLTKGVSLSVVDNDSDNVLMYAALYSTASCMEQLLSAGADPNLQNKFGETAIFWSVHDLQKTELLLKHKAKVNHKSKTGNTPLLVAAVGEGQQNIIRTLINAGGDCRAKNTTSVNVLMQVALYGDTSIARVLLDKGVDINAMRSGGETALFLATKSENIPMVSFLIKNGADVNLKDIYNATVLSYAVVLNNPGLVKEMLPYVKDINEQDIDGMSVLMWATYNEFDNPELVKAILEAGASLKLKDKNGLTAKDWALKKGNSETLKLLNDAELKSPGR